MKARKSLARRYFRFATDPSITAEYLKRIKKAEDDEKCWWSEAPRQNREHLFKECRHWRRQQEKLWKDLEKVGHTKTHALSSIFAEPKATAAILEFLESAGVGKAYNEEETKRREEEIFEQWGWEEMEEQEAGAAGTGERETENVGREEGNGE